MSALQLWLQNHNRKLTQDAIDEALMEYIMHVESQRDALKKQRDELLANAEESDAVRDRLAKLLSETAIALKGEEEALQRHSWHDLPVVALAAMLEITILKQQRDELLAKVAAWEQKAANWMASPEAAQRLDGYRDLAQRLNISEQQRDELLVTIEKLTGVLANIGITSGLYDDEQDALKAACDVIASMKGGE